MGRPSSGRRSASSTLGHPAPHCRRRQGKAATGFQWGRPEPGYSSNTSPHDARAIDHRRAAYPGRAQESSGGCRGPTGRKLCLPKAGIPLGASRRDFTIHAGSLGPHQAHTQHSACGPGSPRQRAPPPQPSSPPRREGVGDATTAGRIRVPRLNHPVRRLSAGPYDECRSRPGSEPRLLSQSTRGRRGRNCGSRITGWPANWVERTMTTSSSAISPCSSPTPLEPGWSICLRGRSPIGTTWSKPLPATSRAHTCALETPRISEAAASSRESLSGTTSGDSRSSAPSCPTSPTWMSSARSSPAPLAATW
jgi:hypothetical protein